ncbi:MAG: type 1 glutamine amidotransferase domain-containing protein [Gemmatimonadota bacterium]|nr:type 1 glutamine amidotransferase domain-containing protein [Gemmatimonadota bacterium]
MNDDPLDTDVLVVVTSRDRVDEDTPTGLWLEEFAVPYGEFLDHGYAVTVASPEGGIVPIDPRSEPDEEAAERWEDALARLRDTLELAVIDPAEHDAIFLPGGHGTMFDFPGNRELTELLLAFARDDKPIAAVCHGPAAFVGIERADGRPFVDGVRMTAFTDAEEREVGLVEEMPFLLESRLREEGAHFVAEENWADHVERDGRVITGQNPRSSASAARELALALQEAKTARAGGRPRASGW